MRKEKWLAGVLAATLAAASFAPTAAAESLWKNANGYTTKSVFTDHRASNVGDIVTIVISESTTTSARRNSSNEKSGSVKLGGGIGIFDFLQA
ncbi:MAG: flagellar basal body L-ring protein FlgH, partial [Selenomonas sp.]|nr:flagellar basal body L-ring protein FlgH [Selenomonas sp.]